MNPDSARMPRSMHPIHSGALQQRVLPSAALSPGLRDRSVDNFALRSNLRTPPLFRSLLLLQKCVGIALSTTAWLIFLAGLAHLILAAVHNQQGELGLGLDSTVMGAKYCIASFVLAAAGLPQWVMSARRLNEARAQLN